MPQQRDKPDSVSGSVTWRWLAATCAVIVIGVCGGWAAVTQATMLDHERRITRNETVLERLDRIENKLDKLLAIP